MNYCVLFLTCIFFQHVCGLGEFVAHCTNNRRAQDDPLVYPGQPGKSHMHDFFGAYNVDAFSTPETMRNSATSCVPALDHSSYWTPTLIYNGQYVAPERTTLYYHAFFNHAQVQPLPLGLQMIAREFSWSCLGGTRTNNPADPLIPNCGNGKIEMFIDYPQCWNGVDLKSADFMSHVAYANQGRCPQGFPVLIPRVQFKFLFPVPGGPATTLSSGGGSTAHSDFVNGWEPEAMNIRVVECLRKDTKCDETLPQDANIVPTFNTTNATYQTFQPIPTAIPTNLASDTSADNTIAPPPSVQRPVNSIEIIAEADTFVRGGTEATNNFGDQLEIAIKRSTNLLFHREGYIRFDLNTITNEVLAAFVELYVDTDITSADAFTFNLGFVSNNAWDERTLNYNTKPTSTLISNATRNLGEEVIQIDVTNFLKQALATRKFSVQISMETVTTPQFYFKSREAGGFTAPKLVVTQGTNALTLPNEEESNGASFIFISWVLSALLSLLL